MLVNMLTFQTFVTYVAPNYKTITFFEQRDAPMNTCQSPFICPHNCFHMSQIIVFSMSYGMLELRAQVRWFVNYAYFNLDKFGRQRVSHSCTMWCVSDHIFFSVRWDVMGQVRRFIDYAYFDFEHVWEAKHHTLIQCGVLMAFSFQTLSI